MRPDYDQLLQMEDPLASRPMRFGPEDPREDNADTFAAWVYGLFAGEAQATPPLRLVTRMGKQATDLMWSTYPPLLVGSQRLIDTLTSEHISGWTTYAIEAHDRSGQRLTGYYGFAITGRTGNQDMMRGEVIDKPPIVPKGKPYKVLRGLYFEGDAWDGSDLCVVGGTSIKVASPRVRAVLKRAKISNVTFTPLATKELDVSIFVSFGRWPAARAL